MCNLLSGTDQVPAEHVLVGVMVDLEEHCFPPATTLSEGGATWERVSPFPVILVHSSCSSSATVWVSCEVDVGGLL